MVTKICQLTTKKDESYRSQKDVKFDRPPNYWTTANLDSDYKLMKRHKKIGNSQGRKLHKFSFAESLESIHEIPHNDLFSKADFCKLTLPSMPLARYTPLTSRDPYAKVSTKKITKPRIYEEFDPFKLPFLPGGGIIAQKKPQPKKQHDHSRAQRAALNDNGFRVGSTLHFKYSEYVGTNGKKNKLKWRLGVKEDTM